MPIVKVGDQRIKFPDSMSQEQIQAALQQQFGGPSQTAQEAPQEAQAVPGPTDQVEVSSQEAEQLRDPLAALPTTLNFAGFDTGIEIPQSVSKGLVGAGKELHDAYLGIQQILAGAMGDEETVEELAARGRANQEAFAQLDNLGVGAEDAGQIIADGLMFLVPGGQVKGAIKAGALGGAIVEGMKVADSNEDQLMNAAIGGTAGAVGAKVGDMIGSPVRTALGPIRAVMERMPATRLWSGLLAQGRQASLKDQRAAVIRDATRRQAGAANRSSREQAIKQNQDAARRVIEEKILPVVQTLNQRGKAEFLDNAVNRFSSRLAEAGQSQQPAQVVRQAWDETFGMFNNATLNREFKTHGKQIVGMGKVIEKFADQLSPAEITKLAAAAASKEERKGLGLLIALGKENSKASVSTLRKVMRTVLGEEAAGGSVAATDFVREGSRGATP